MIQGPRKLCLLLLMIFLRDCILICFYPQQELLFHCCYFMVFPVFLSALSVRNECKHPKQLKSPLLLDVIPLNNLDKLLIGFLYSSSVISLFRAM